MTTTTGAKLVTIPKTSSGKTSVAIVKIPSSGPTVTRVTKTSPQTSVMKRHHWEEPTQKNPI